MGRKLVLTFLSHTRDYQSSAVSYCDDCQYLNQTFLDFPQPRVRS